MLQRYDNIAYRANILSFILHTKQIILQKVQKEGATPYIFFKNVPLL